MALAGKNVVVEVSTNDTLYNAVKEINDMSISASGDNIDITEFGDDFINRLQGLKDCTFSLSGFYDPTDTTGQVVIQNAWLNDSILYVRIKPNGVAGFKQEVKVSTFEVSASVDGAVEVSIDLEGSGNVTIA